MSWDSYIDNIIGHSSGHCDKACIIGQDGTKWSTDNHANALRITAAEAATIGKVFASGDITIFEKAGIVAGGVKYDCPKADVDVKIALGKKTDCGAITCASSKTAVVIGHTKEGGEQGNTNKAVVTIAEYLASLGY